MIWEKQKIYRSEEGHMLKVGLGKDNAKSFKVELNLRKILADDEIKLIDGESFFTKKEGFLIKDVEVNSLADGHLTVAGRLADNFDLDKYEPDAYDEWIKLENFKSHNYEDGAVLYTFNIKQHKDPGFLYSIPKENVGQLGDYFRDNKEDRITQIINVYNNNHDVTVLGHKKKAL
ncbi:hypothetical protein [Priestia megaterium]|uniref:hypothetical protein n=1 Tax=Priestia megaterium TaxID=1404 RepID=UPI003101800F